MKVKHLLREIAECAASYNDFLDWDVAVEHHKKPEDCANCKDEILTDGEGWKYIKCHGFWTKMEKDKVFTVNIHY